MKSFHIFSNGLRLKHSSQYETIRFRYDSRNLLLLKERGSFEDVFPDTACNEIHDLFKKGPQSVYAGFDPTASSLHIGNLLVLKHLINWQRAGHKVHALIGTATAQVGDPSGRFKDREQQNYEIIMEQGIAIKKNIETIFLNHETYFWSRRKEAPPLVPVIYLSNHDWYSKMNVIKFMDIIGRHFRIGSMLLKDSVSRRLNSDSGMNFAEFSYQIFQAFDWYHLYENNGCKFQVGGKDQMGNIEAGHRLIRKLLDKPSYGFTLPLVKNDAGDKFGKSVENAVFLDSRLTTPFDFYQFLLRTSDTDATKLYKLFSFEPFQAVDNAIDQHFKNPGRRYLQGLLAEEVTLLVHGDEGLEQAKATSSILYSKDIDKLAKLNVVDLEKLIPGCNIVDCKFRIDYNILNLALDIRVFLSKADAVRTMQAGGFSINLQLVTNPFEILSTSVHILPNKITLVRVGKKNYTIVRWLID